MSELSSTEKGDLLENKLYQTIVDMIHRGDFVAQEKYCKVFQKKKYPSKDRNGKDITFDVVVEVTYKDHLKPTVIYVFECKNYKKRVSGTIIAGFSKEIEGVGQNIVPTIVTTVGLQDSALEFARTNRIGLIIINNQNPIEWIMPRKHKSIKTDSLIHDGDNYSINSDFLCLYGESQYKNIGDFLEGIGILDNYHVTSNQFDVPYFTSEYIKKVVSSASKNLYKGDRLEMDKLCPYLIEKYGVIFDFDMPIMCDESGLEILGKTFITENKISISKSLIKDSGRWRFTLAHEIGHYILHRKLLSERIEEITDDDNSLLLENDKMIDNSRLEIQANLFALELLLPEESFKREIQRYLRDERLTYPIFVDLQKCNQQNLIKAILHISTYFGVSRAAAKKRLTEFGFIHYDGFII